jgi:GT2 family glycosyltransferase
VVVGWREAAHLLEGLRVIESVAPSTAHEVIVSLNAPSAKVTNDLEERVIGARVISSQVNRGFAAACNRGAALARGEFLVFLNDDAEICPGWLEALVAAAEDEEEAGAVGSLALDNTGAVVDAGGVVWRDGSTSLVTAGVMGLSSLLETRRRVDYCGGASLLVKRSVWDAVGGFDEAYFPAYCEDVDLCFSIARHGEYVIFEPASRVVHLQGASESLGYRQALWKRNNAIFRSRWKEDLSWQLDHENRREERLPMAIVAAAERRLPRGGRSFADRSHEADVPSQSSDPEPIRTDLDALRCELAIREQYSHDLEVHYANLESAFRDLRISVDTLQIETGRLSAELQRSRAEIERVHKTLSWRLTKPLRIVRSFWK